MYRLREQRDSKSKAQEERKTRQLGEELIGTVEIDHATTSGDSRHDNSMMCV